MSLRSIRALRKGGVRIRKGADAATVTPLFDQPLAAGDRDPRLAIQKGILTGDRAAFEQAMRLDPTNRAAPLLAAYHAWIDGDREEARRLTAVARERAPENVTVTAMACILDLAEGKATPDAVSDANFLQHLPVVTDRVQGELLRIVEERIVALAPDDKGASDREDMLRGPIGWVLDRFDNVALLIGWGAGHVLNTLLNGLRPDRWRAYRHVIAGDLANGFAQRERAKNAFTKALKADASNLEAAESLITFALEEGKVDDAARRIAAYRAALSADGDDPFASPFYGPTLRRWLADLAWLKGDYSDAAEQYGRVVGEDLYGWFPPYRLGLCHTRLGDPASARSAFTEALDRINPHLLEERLQRLAELL